MAEIRLFAGDFAPKTWSYCNGTLLAISTNQALFSLLGTTYGGNGVQTFALPDLRGRIPVGVGNGSNGVSSYTIGEITGTENVGLLPTDLPQHTHPANVTSGAGQPSATATLFGIDNVGGQTTPGGNFLGMDGGGSGATTYSSSGTLTAMNAGSVALSNVTLAVPSATVNIAGGSQPHNNIMPSLVLNYIICLYGIYPSRN